MQKVIVVFAGAAAAAGCARNEAPLPPPPPAPVVPQVPAVGVNSTMYGPNFVAKAMSGGVWEIQSGQLALRVSSDPAVRSFAQMLITDHMMLNNQMAAAARSAGLPPPPPVMLPTRQYKLKQLRDTPPAGFDWTFREMQIAAHEQTIYLFRNYASFGDTPALRNAAAQAIPVLEKHRAALQAMRVTRPPVEPSPPRAGERG